MTRYQIVWSYWLVTALSLTLVMVGPPGAIWITILITIVHLAHMAVLDGGRFPLQVRAVYLLLLVLGAWPPMSFLQVVQFVGTWAVVLFNYCLLARCLSLLPGNRRVPLTTELMWRTFVSKPVNGNIASEVLPRLQVTPRAAP